MGRPKGSKNKPKVENSTPTNYSVNEIKTYIEKTKEERQQEVFAKTSQALKLVDLTKTETRTYSTFNRETIRTYLKSPKAYEKQIRNLSKYLYRLSYEYRRICIFYATMICGDAFSITPNIDLSSEISDEDILSNYYETLNYWQRMDFVNELVKLLIVAWREDSIYGYIYDDSDKDGGTFYTHVLDGDYCRISGMENGVPRFAFDFSYFRIYPQDLEYWDKEFKTKFNKYQSDSTLRWQELESDREICFKVNIDDPKMDHPPFTNLFEKLIDLLDLQAIQKVKDDLSIYKLLVARLQVLSGSDEPDNFEVDPAVAVEYYNKMAQQIDESVGFVLSPMPIDVINLDGNNNTKDTDMISAAMNNIFKTIGGVILDNTKTGSTIYEAQIQADVCMAQSTLVPQINRWLNLYFNQKIGETHATIKYIDGVSPYTKSKIRKQLLESAQNGLGTVLDIGVLDGNTPKETISKLKLQQALGLSTMLDPLSTSYTKSSSDASDPITGGAPTKDATELTDSGSKTRENK